MYKVVSENWWKGESTLDDDSFMLELMANKLVDKILDGYKQTIVVEIATKEEKLFVLKHPDWFEDYVV